MGTACSNRFMCGFNFHKTPSICKENNGESNKYNSSTIIFILHFISLYDIISEEFLFFFNKIFLTFHLSVLLN